MSAVVETFIMCDGCGQSFGVDTRHRAAYSHRVKAKSEGWRLVKGKDYCPTCQVPKTTIKKYEPDECVDEGTEEINNYLDQ